MWRFLKSKEEPEEPGLIQLNSDERAEDEAGAEMYEVDIVAIHGLNGTPFGTWTHENSTFWLKDLLPRDVRGARIFTYKYPSRVLFSKSKATTEEYAKTLLIDLKDNRNGVGQDRRPIIFIAHSLGGIICKQALLIANQDPMFTLLLDRTEGVIFFGTPHRGARTSADLGIFFVNIVQIASTVSIIRPFVGRARNELLKNLRANSPDLRRITESFKHLHDRLHIVSVYETEEQVPLGRLIVDEDSATLGIQGEETIPRYKCHTEMCRYSGRSDPGYRTILRAITDLCKRSNVGPVKESEKSCIELFNRFDFEDYRSDLSQSLEGTCEWVLESSQYQQWFQDIRPSLLWITGHVGSGKTTLSSYITRVFGSEQSTSKKSSRLCYFFCDNNGTEQQRDARGILCSLIFQILRKRGDLVRHVEPALEYDKDGAQLLQSYGRLWSIFETIVSDDRLGPLNIVIDALDECEEKSGNRIMEDIARLIDSLRLVPTRCVKFLITSRPQLKLTEHFNSYRPQDLKLGDRKSEIDEDLRKVIEHRMTGIANKTRAKPDEIKELKRFLSENADQSFLWVKLTLDILDKELSTAVRNFRSILAGVPRSYQATYRRLLDEIPPNWKSFARKSLHAIIASYRPLSLDEINILTSMQEITLEKYHSVAGNADQHLRSNFEMDITKVLGSLVRISDSKVYLVHISLKEYLCPSLSNDLDIQVPGPDKVDLCQANLFLASACMAYLSLPDFEEDIFAKEAVGEERVSLLPPQQFKKNLKHCSIEEVSASLQMYDDSVDDYIHRQPQQKYKKHQKYVRIDAGLRAIVAYRYVLFEYAATYWAEHFAQGQELAGKDLQDLALYLSNRRSQHRYYNWFLFFWGTTRFGHRNPLNFDQLAVAGWFGHHTLLQKILDSADFISIENPANALYVASRNGHEKCVTRLLRTNLDPDSCIFMHQSALCSAAAIGHVGVVKALATDSRVNINFKGTAGITPLSFAADSGHIEIVKFLLSQDRIEPNAENIAGWTPITHAMRSDHKEVSQILIADARVDLNCTFEDSPTPTTEVEQERVEETIALLIKQPRFDVDLPSIHGRTVLADAAMKGNAARIEELSWRGFNNSHSHNHKDGRTAISLAAGGGHKDVIKLLHEEFRVPGIDEEDDSGKTALYWALLNHRNDTAEYLTRSKCVDINHKDHDGRTALSWAASSGNEAGLRLLLETDGIKPHIEDNEGLTPLQRAQGLDNSSRIASTMGEYLQKKG